MRSIRHHGRKDAGANLVEFALVVPILALFLFGIVQFGLAYDQKQSINSAAREGARTAAIADASVTHQAIVDRVEGSFDGLGASGGPTVNVFIVDPSTGVATAANGDNPCGPPNGGQTVRVVAVVNFEGTIPFFGVINRPLTGTGEFRCEIDQ